MILRSISTAALLLASVVVLTGCLGPAPAPTPTATPVFSSEEEAFAAAEETYRAYSAAANARRADATSSPDPFSFLIAAALEAALDAQTQLDQHGVHPVGDTHIDRLDHIEADPTTGAVVIDVCLNSSAVRVVDESGADVTPTTRSDFVLLRVSLVHVDNALLIERSETEKSNGC